jgi:hypothetical protein
MQIYFHDYYYPLLLSSSTAVWKNQKKKNDLWSIIIFHEELLFNPHKA